MQTTASVHSYKVLSPTCYPQVKNESVIRFMGVIRPAGLVLRPSGKLVRGKQF